MGASAWDYVTAYKGDLAATLAALQEEVFGAMTWLREELERWELPQPATFRDLYTETYSEWLWNAGTHSIIDAPSMEEIEPLSAAETIATFDTAQPTRADWDRVAGEQARGVEDLMYERWSGRCVVLHKDGAPDEVAFWGYSGD